MMRSKPLFAFLLLSVAVGLASIARHAAAAEPAQEFLRQLRSSGYHDTALLYLDRVRQGQFGNPALQQVADLEEAQIRLEAAAAARTLKEREALFAGAETALRRFVAENPQSERIPEAQLQLANLLMVRGTQALESEATAEPERRAAARQAFTDATEVFDRVAEGLRATLKEMQGQRINGAEQPQLAAQRDQYRVQFLQALLLGGNARERTAETFPDGSEEAQQRLREALERYEELTDKYDRYVPGALAMLYRAQVQEKLGQSKAALDSYQRVLEQAEVDALRGAKIKALAAAIRLWLAQDPPQASVAVGRGQPWLDSIRPDERRDPAWQQLRLQLAKANLQLADQQAKEKGGANEARRSRAAAQLALNAAAGVPGPHQAEARELLGSLGIERNAEEPAESDEPESFDEALATAQRLIEKAESESLALGVMEENSATDEAENSAARRAEVAQRIESLRSQAAGVLRTGFTLVSDETDEEAVNKGRYYLAYLQFKRERFHEAAVVSEFLSRRYPGSSYATSAGVLAMNAYQALLGEQDETLGEAAAGEGVTGKLEQLADYLIAQWPNDPQAAAAGELLVRVALSQDRWEDAQEYLEKIPEDSPSRGALQRLLGQLQWNGYLKASQAGAEDAAALLDKSVQSLAGGLERLAAEDAQPIDMQAALVLAKARLEQDDPAGALAALDHEAAGPLRRLSGPEALAPPKPEFPADAYSTALRSLVTLATDADEAAPLLDRAAKVMDLLRDSVAKNADGGTRLTGIYYDLARDIRSQLDAAPPARQTKLIAAFKLLLDRLANTVQDPATLHWIARTQMEMAASQIAEDEFPAVGAAKDLLDGAASAYQHLLDSGKAENELQVRFELARTNRLRGNYREAIDQLDRVLQQQNSMIDAQIEAALTYQQWARTGSPKLYSAAMLGGRKDEASGKNTIWGWGRISVLTASQKEFRDKFFEARYRLAECRYRLAMRQTDPEEQRKLGEQATSDISQIARLYPDFGGDQYRRRFDELLRNIQRLRGVATVGLAEFDAADASGAATRSANSDTIAAAPRAAAAVESEDPSDVGALPLGWLVALTSVAGLMVAAVTYWYTVK